MLRELQPKQYLSVHFGNIIIELFRIRDKEICEAHRDVNKEGHYYKRHLPSIFLSNLFMKQLLENFSFNRNSCFDCYTFNETENNRRIYIILYDDESKQFSLITVCIISHMITLYNVKHTLSESYTKVLVAFLKIVIPSYDGEWFMTFDTYLKDIIINNIDCGLYVFLCIYYLCYEVPLLFESDIINLRNNLAYWIMIGKLPI